MKTICVIKNGAGQTVHEFTYEDGKLYADGEFLDEYENEQDAIEAVWSHWHDGGWNK